MSVLLPRRRYFLHKGNKSNVCHSHNPGSSLLGHAVFYLGNKKPHTGDMKHEVNRT